MADKLTSPRSARSSFTATSGPLSSSRSSAALEVTANGFDAETRDEIVALERELQVAKEQAAIAREQEAAATRRAEELARANEALKSSIDALAKDQEIDSFLGQVLRSITDQFQSPSSALWLFQRDNPQLVSLHLVYEPGGIAEGASHALRGKGEVMDMRNGAAHQRILRGEQVAMDVATYPEILPDQRAYLISRGTETLLSTPIAIGDRVLGAFVLDFPGPRIFDTSELELARALSNQAALALEMTYKAEKANEAAIAREQEEAATRRAEVLARANAAMAKTVGRLVEQPDIRNFVGEVLSVFAFEFVALGVEFWRYTSATGQFAPTLSYDRSSGQISGDENVFAELNRGRTEVDHDLDALNLNRKIVRITEAQFEELPGVRTFANQLRAMGVRTILCVPLFIADECLGSIAMRLDHDRTLSPSEEELAFALAQQLALALQLTRLAEEAKQAAIAREQEEAATRRAEVLARANAAMAKTVGRLVEQPDIRNFVGEVLRVFATEFNAIGCEYWNYDAASGRFDAALSFDRASGVLTGDGNALQRLNQAKAADDPSGVARNFAGIINRITDAEFDTIPAMLPFRNLMRSQGVRTILAVPMFIKDEYFGNVALRLDHDRTLTASEEELAFALAQQLTLALQLTRLADEAKQVAIAREQEEAAQQRVAQLAKANGILRSTVDVMTSIPALDEYLGTVMVAINESLGANGSTLWLFDYTSETARLAMTAIGGVWSPTPPAFGTAVLATHFPSGDELQNERLRNQPTFNPSIQRHPHVDAGTKAWLAYLNVNALQELPIRVGGKVIGSLSIHCEANEPFPPEKLELALVLTQQLGLATHITRLAEEAKQAAIAREQEEAAQQRVAQLAEANEILRSTVEKMTSIPALDEFLGAVMLAINESLSASGSTFWMFDLEKRRNELTMTAIESRWSRTPPEYGGFTLARGYDLPPEYIEHIQSPGRWLFTPNIRNHALIDDGTRNWLKHLGVVALHEFAIVIGRRTIGTLVIHCEANEPFPAEKLELAVVLAQQLGLAIHITRLAEEVKQAAIAREQEEAASQRAAVLARANVVMAKTIGRLVEEPGIRNFTGQVLDVFATEFDAIGVEFWSYDVASHWFSPVLSFDRATGELTGEDNDWQRLNERRSVPAEAEDEATLAGRITRITSNDIEESPALAPFRERLLADGVRTIIGVPLQVRDKHLGTICMRFQSDRTLNAAEEELAFALAQQLALALQLSRLADEAQQAAVLREQERAAVEQAAELVKANRAISSSLAKLAAYPDMEAFLGQILISIATHLGEADGGVWLFDPSLERLTLRLSLEDGRLLKEGFYLRAKWLIFDEDSGENTKQEEGKESSGGNRTASHGLHNRVTIHTLDEIRTLAAWEPYRETIEQGGFQCTMEVPMFVGDELIGFYAIRAKHHQTFSASEIELAQALAHQAALACHVRRLAEQTAESAQQTAIAEERNRLARDIHDTLAQGFAAIAMQLQGATRERASLPRAVRPYLERAIELTRDNLAEARKSVGALRSHESPSGGFLPTLTRLIEEARKRSSALIELKLDCQSLSIPRNVEDELLRIAQEALNNATKHSSAKRIVIDVTAAGDGLRLKIQDDGTGFNADMPTAGYGLGIMQERAKRVGATWTLITEPDNGTEVIAVWSPKPESSEKND